MFTRSILLTFLTTTLVLAQKPLFTGTWELDPAKSQMSGADKPTSMTLVVEQPEQEEISIQETAKVGASEKKYGYKCSTMGKECQFRDGKETVKLSMYYNGPALVGMATVGKGGDAVSKRRYILSEDGSTLTVEVMHIVPPRQDIDKLVFSKQAPKQ